MAKSIRISPKHGVNPTIPVCFFCGKEKKQVALLGKLKDDAEAPRNMVLDYEPCDDCKALFEENILLMGVTETSPDGRPPIQGNLYPTGSYAVVKPHIIPQLFTADVADEILEHKKAFLEEPVMQELIQITEEAKDRQADTDGTPEEE